MLDPHAWKKYPTWLTTGDRRDTKGGDGADGAQILFSLAPLPASQRWRQPASTVNGHVRGDPEAQLTLSELDEALDLGVFHEAIAVPVGAPDGEPRSHAGESRVAAADGLPDHLGGQGPHPAAAVRHQPGATTRRRPPDIPAGPPATLVRQRPSVAASRRGGAAAAMWARSAS